MNTRRSFLGLLAGGAVALALPPVAIPVRRPSTTDLSLSISEFEELYIRPAVEVWMKAFEGQLLASYASMGLNVRRLQRSDWQHLDPARLPL